MSTQFDLEQRIMQCWGVVDDIEVLYTQIMNTERYPDKDQLSNVLLGLQQLYDMKFYNLMSTFEEYLKEKHNG